MKLLFVWPSSQFSTYDVARGLRRALTRVSGVEVVDYVFYNRMQIWGDVAEAMRIQMGHEKDVLDIESVCENASEGIPYAAMRHGCTHALIVSGLNLHPNVIWCLKSLGIKVSCWFTEGPYDKEEYQPDGLAELLDVAFTNERTSVPMFEKLMGPNKYRGNRHSKVLYLPHAYDPDFHNPDAVNIASESGVDVSSENSDVLFVGTGFTERQVLIENVDWTGINFAIGGTWAGVRQNHYLARYVKYPSIDNRVTTALYLSSKIVLNPHRWASGAESCNPRVYEAAACGAFQISDRRAEIEEMFDGAVPTFDPGVPWQLGSLVRRYLEDDREREVLARQARAVVTEGHNTFDDRLRTILEVL